MITKTAIAGMCLLAFGLALAQTDVKTNNTPVSNNIIDEVVWVVGDEPIYKSEVQEMYEQAQYEGTVFKGSPYCEIPEQIAVEKLYLHQAKMDTIEAPESMVRSAVDRRINDIVSWCGSTEMAEQRFRKTMPQIREQLSEQIRNQYIISQVQENLTKNVKSTPNDVRKYYANLPSDSLPFVPMQMEVQILTQQPAVSPAEIESIKSRLREYADRVNKGEADFSTLAIMYSEDGSNMQGGELGFHGRADFVPEFSNVAFNLSDPNKVSRIVETEYGYHIIQLIEKRGDLVNCRHILLRPKVTRDDINKSIERLDTIRTAITDGKVTFEAACQQVSQDKDTRNNKGIMMNQRNGSARFEMQELPPEVAAMVASMQPGDISMPFEMRDPQSNKQVVAIVKLTNRIEGHKANLSEDYNTLKQMCEEAQKDQILKDWVEKKIKSTFVRIEEGWDNCDFHYKGWRKY